MDHHPAMKGFTLFELIIVVAIAGLILVTVLVNAADFINRAKFRATVREMGSIAQAAIDFYNNNNAWPPADASLLGSPYMPQAVGRGPFGNTYTISPNNSSVRISTIIPAGVPIDLNEGSFLSVSSVAGGQQINITQSIPNEFTGRLTYDLLYIDKQ